MIDETRMIQLEVDGIEIQPTKLADAEKHSIFSYYHWHWKHTAMPLVVVQIMRSISNMQLLGMKKL